MVARCECHENTNLERDSQHNVTSDGINDTENSTKSYLKSSNQKLT
jgi:hypothetical protein